MNKVLTPTVRIYVLLLLVLTFFSFSCNKSNSNSGLLVLQSALLVEPNQSPVTWHLTGYAVGGLSQPLNIAQQHYTKKYTFDYNFTTSDGFTGTWNIPSNGTLVETYSNFPVGGSATQTYTIVTNTPNTLTLQYTTNGSTITTTYTAGN